MALLERRVIFLAELYNYARLVRHRMTKFGEKYFLGVSHVLPAIGAPEKQKPNLHGDEARR